MLFNPEKKVRCYVTSWVVLGNRELKYFTPNNSVTLAANNSVWLKSAYEHCLLWHLEACCIYKHSCRQMKEGRCKARVASLPRALSGCTFSSVSKAGSFSVRVKTFCHICAQAALPPLRSQAKSSRDLFMFSRELQSKYQHSMLRGLWRKVSKQQVGAIFQSAITWRYLNPFDT